jgi:hypothetical protein
MMTSSAFAGEAVNVTIGAASTDSATSERSNFFMGNPPVNRGQRAGENLVADKNF